MTSRHVEAELGPFWTLDIPLEPTVLTLVDEDGEQLSLSEVTSVQARLLTPLDEELDGINIGAPNGPFSAFSAVVQDDTIVLTWPTGSVLLDGGIYWLKLRLNNKIYVQPFPFVVQEEDGWLTVSGARDQWRDAPEDVTLWELLEVAKLQCLDFAPKLAADAPVPVNYRKAQRMQARNLWNSTKADPSGQIGEDGFAIRPFPMDWVVKNILRPKRGKPVVA